MDNGLAADTPVVPVEGASRPGENRHRHNLAELEAQPPAMAELPILIGIGAVFAAVGCNAINHSSDLFWQSNRPAPQRPFAPARQVADP